MKLHLLAYLALGLASVGLARADYSFTEPFSKSNPFHANGEISLENINGNVEIRTWGKNEILIEGEKSAKTDEELKLIDLTIAPTPFIYKDVGTYVIPGHGRLSEQMEVVDYRDMVVLIRDNVADQMKQRLANLFD